MIPNFEDHFDLFIPKDLNITDPAERKMIGDKIKTFYFNGKSVNKDTEMELVNLLSDVHFNAGMILTTKIINARNTAPIYQYYFSYYAPYSVLKTVFKVKDGKLLIIILCI